MEKGFQLLSEKVSLSGKGNLQKEKKKSKTFPFISYLPEIHIYSLFPEVPEMPSGSF